MDLSSQDTFQKNYELYITHLRLKSLSSSTIDAYSRAVRKTAEHFGWKIDALTSPQLAKFFGQLAEARSESVLGQYFGALKFYYAHVLEKPFPAPSLIRRKKSQRLPDILTVDEVQRVISRTRVLSFRVFFFTLYSLGLRLAEGLDLRVGDIDHARGRVHIRDAKGNKDRFVPLPNATYHVLREFWKVHRNPELIFPSRVGHQKDWAKTDKHLERHGVQIALGRVIRDCGLKKRLPFIPYATLSLLT